MSEQRPNLSKGANSKINTEKLCIVDIKRRANSLANKLKSLKDLLNETQNTCNQKKKKLLTRAACQAVTQC